MPESTSTLNRYNQIMSEYQGMSPVDASTITQDFMKRVGNFQPQYQELAKAEQSAYSAPAELMAQYQQQYGSDSGPDSFARLANAMNMIGTRMGTANALSNAINAGQGNIRDLANSTLGQYNALRQAKAEQGNQLMSLYNTQLNSEFQRQQLAAQQAQAAAQAQREAAAAELQRQALQNAFKQNQSNQFVSNAQAINTARNAPVTYTNNLSSNPFMSMDEWMGDYTKAQDYYRQIGQQRLQNAVGYLQSLGINPRGMDNGAIIDMAAQRGLPMR